nr:TonB-dependent receptor [Mannheimia varigena]
MYYNHFKNYIYNENLFRENQLFMHRYNQAKVRFYGVEAEASYRFNE